MSLTDEAVQAIAQYRKCAHEEPTNLEKHIKDLQRELTKIGRRDQNIFYTVERKNFPRFPETETFDREEYLTFRYLFESSYKLRRLLVQQKAQQLERMAQAMLVEHPSLAKEFASIYDSFSLSSINKRLDLKTEAKCNGVSSSLLWFVIKKVSANPKAFSVDHPFEWIEPDKYKTSLHLEFRKSSKQLGLSWGMTPGAVDYFITHIELKKIAEKVAIVSGVAAGSVLAAWGLSRALNSAAQSSQSSLAAAAGVMAVPITSMASGGTIPVQPLYGLENYPQFMVPPTAFLNANQGAFLNYLKNLGSTNAYDLQIAMLDNKTARQNALQQTVANILNPQVDYTGIASAASASLGNVFSGQKANLLGAPADLMLTNYGDDMAIINGTVCGQAVSAQIQRMGNMIRFSSN